MLKIGVTGHRNINKKFVEEYKQQIVKKLNELKQKHQEIIILTPLADGADRLIIYEAIKLNIKYIAILPMEKNLYQEDFDITSKTEFEYLLKNAEYIYTILQSNPFSKNRQYELVGRCISNSCDILFALWDGKQTGLIGGTSETVKYHINLNKDLWHLKVLRNRI